MPDIMEQIKDICAAGVRVHQKKFALERLARARNTIAAKLEGTSALSYKDILEAIDLDIDYAERQIAGMM